MMVVEGDDFIPPQPPFCCCCCCSSASAVALPLASKHPADKQFVYFGVARSFQKEDFLENSRILSCLVQLKSVLFNLLYVFDR